jgi:Ca2+-binding RTX toxin-like protein
MSGTSPTIGNDSLVGTSENDTIDLMAGNDSYLGLEGDDSILGGDGADTLDGGEGDNRIRGGMGNDWLLGGYGSQALYGEADDDVLIAEGGFLGFLDGGDGADSLIATFGSENTLHGGTGNDTLIGEGSLSGGDDDDNLQGSGTLDGGIGADTIIGDYFGGEASLVGGDGADRLQGIGTLDGGIGDDILIAEEAYAASLSGGSGADTLVAGNSYDATLLGGEGSDSLVDTSGNWQEFLGGGGNDTLRVISEFGSSGRLDGGAGDDLYIMEGIVDSYFYGPAIFEASGNDTLSFQGSSDVEIFGFFGPAVSGIEAINLAGGGNRLNLTASRVRDLSDTDVLRVIGGANDTLIFGDLGWARGAVADGFITLTNGGATVIASENLAPPVLLPTNGNDSLSGTNADDAVDLLAGNDVYDALAGNDSVLGGLGNDSINGANGADTLSAGEGNDIIFGGNGSDSIDGGNGYDVIDYRDFSASQGISIDLAAGRANDGMGGMDSFLGIEAVFGSSQSDTMIGGEGGDNLVGSFGNDSLLGNRCLRPTIFYLDCLGSALRPLMQQVQRAWRRARPMAATMQDYGYSPSRSPSVPAHRSAMPEDQHHSGLPCGSTWWRWPNSHRHPHCPQIARPYGSQPPA